MNATQKRISFLTLILFFFTFLPIQTVQAATLTVTNTSDSGAGSLRQTIADAASGDTITFDDALSGGTITLASTLTLTKNVTIDGSALSSPISISGNSTVRIFLVNSGITVILDSLLIEKGFSFAGAGISNLGNLTVNNSTFSNNTGDTHAGSIDNIGILNVNDCTFSGNSADQNGGVIFNHHILSINNSTFSANSAYYGGGIYNTDTLSINNSTFSANSAYYGGGIYNVNTGTVDVDNSTFSGNSASFSGGGFFTGGTVDVDNSTFSGNSANFGGGIYNDGTALLGFRNTILAKSPSGFDCYNDSGTITSGTINNLIETQFSCDPSANTTDPLLAPLADNGGDTQTMALLPGSVAINAGDNATCTSTDQRGVTRTLGGTCDIGAYESGAAILKVSSSTPAGNTSLTSATSIAVTFSEDALHDGSNKAANYNDNYLLVERGSNNTFDTQSCADGLQADDTAIPFSLGYDSSTFTSTITLSNPLSLGSYRLFVCGTTSIWSAAGLELNNGSSDAIISFSVVNPSVSILPDTGFPMGLKTGLPTQPAAKTYNGTDLALEIPSLNLSTDIVGVPFVEDTWDVSWLGSNTGWLEGSAAPTWPGNTVLTGHVWDANNQPGVFANLKSLKYGDQFYIHAWGQTYTYEVRDNKLILAGNTKSVLQHEKLDWITLLTCESYNPTAQTYPFRRMVRAVLVSIE